MGLKMATPWKHPNSGIYYLLERVPSKLVDNAKCRTVIVPLDGKPHPIKRGHWAKLSVRTKDATEAKGRYKEAAAALLEHWRLIEHAGIAGRPIRRISRIATGSGNNRKIRFARRKVALGSSELTGAEDALDPAATPLSGLGRRYPPR
ncbi:hypothetical protein E7811_03445 [Aliigemmobacter aestuarii]|uniref:Uncharacterized protein n=1 Tax=Aliigemmobacter aestuarii TaxID=1445661 RepID=A0A4S3MRP0_9RHOB|nr:DUF6538 domain-containing protein [Gemmobacter aestuarii]THD84794.1 hypothetical protein E7811_03445 [Gemmobacter aestuarii]